MKTIEEIEKLKRGKQKMYDKIKKIDKQIKKLEEKQ